ncbi:hypothetical protein M3Y96_01033900 [Aphelenchoides besseyi]|nr:hypothetical protein M3Y96_01033900 [Aphelenchoides besseyi]
MSNDDPRFCLSVSEYLTIGGTQSTFGVFFRFLAILDLIVCLLMLIAVLVEKMEHRAKRKAKAIKLNVIITPEFLHYLKLRHKTKPPMKTEDRTENQVSAEFPVRHSEFPARTPSGSNDVTSSPAPTSGKEKKPIEGSTEMLLSHDVKETNKPSKEVIKLSTELMDSKERVEPLGFHSKEAIKAEANKAHFIEPKSKKNDEPLKTANESD